MVGLGKLPRSLIRSLRRAVTCLTRSGQAQVRRASRRESGRTPPHPIMELRGLGKEHWAGVNPAEYVGRERRTWD